ncbi:MAG TPA: hypothetical protein VL588_02420 [Bdellovibrionota bacterium]|nr:hypothetical protein [Bdellovibrionota bacterium]
MRSTGGSMEHVPVTGQGHVGVCYGHAVAQMIDAFRFSHATPVGDVNYAHLSSPMEIAADGMFRTGADGDFDDGSRELCPIAETAIRRGTCSDRRIHDLYSNREASELNTAFSDAYYDFQRYVEARHSVMGLEQLQAEAERRGERLRCELSGLSANMAAMLVPTGRAMGVLLQEPSYNQAMTGLLSRVCSGRARHHVDNRIHCAEGPRNNGQAEMAEVHRLLSQPNPQPVALKICQNFLSEGSSYVGLTATGAFTPSCDKHYLLVIGRRMHNGKCQLLLRNSHGDDDDDNYSKEWEPHHGNIWVDESALGHNTQRVFTLTGPAEH